MQQRPPNRSTLVLLAGGAAAALGVLADWFLRPAFREELEGHDAFRQSRWVAVAVLFAVSAAWVRAVRRRHRRGDPVAALTGTALVGVALVLLCAPFVSSVATSFYDPRVGPLAPQEVLCPGVINAPAVAAEIPGACSDASSRAVHAVLIGAAGLALWASGNRRKASGEERPLNRPSRSGARLWALPMGAAAVWMITLDPARFFLFGKWVALAIATAFAAGWVAIAGRDEGLPDERDRQWRRGRLLLALSLLLLVTPYNFSGSSCQNPHVGSTAPDTAEIDACNISSTFLMVAATAGVVTGAVLVMGRTQPVAKPDRTDGSADDGADEYWPGAP